MLFLPPLEPEARSGEVGKEREWHGKRKEIKNRIKINPKIKPKRKRNQKSKREMKDKKDKYEKQATNSKSYERSGDQRERSGRQFFYFKSFLHFSIFSFIFTFLFHFFHYLFGFSSHFHLSWSQTTIAIPTIDRYRLPLVQWLAMVVF